MCTYETAHVPLPQSSGKLAGRWVALDEATVYLDHPVDAPVGHSLNIDFRRGADRLAVELSPSAARSLAESILSLLDTAPVGLLDAP